MHAEVLSIGDEIASGQLLDTNSQWLSQRLEELGVRVLYHTTVGDDLAAMANVIEQAIGRSQIIISTGGLGPTADDLTRDAIARAAKRSLEFRPDVFASIRQLFERRGRDMPESNRLQAMFPAGSVVVPNPHGTAPGIDLMTTACGNTSRLFALPGVPAEMRDMWHSYVSDAVRVSGGGRTLVLHQKINCFGAGESQIEGMLPDLVRRGRVPRVGINASKSTIILRVTTEGPTDEACRELAAPTIQIIHDALGDLIFGYGDEQLQDAVSSLLERQGKTLAIAEWGTGGMISDLLTSCPRASSHYRGGQIVRDADVFGRLASGAGQGTAAPDSPEGVALMAAACRNAFAADYALAVGPFPEFAPQEQGPPPIHYAWATPAGVETTSLPFGWHPELRKVFAAKWGLNIARLGLLKD